MGSQWYSTCPSEVHPVKLDLLFTFLFSFNELWYFKSIVTLIKIKLLFTSILITHFNWSTSIWILVYCITVVFVLLFMYIKQFILVQGYSVSDNTGHLIHSNSVRPLQGTACIHLHLLAIYDSQCVYLNNFGRKTENPQGHRENNTRRTTQGEHGKLHTERLNLGRSLNFSALLQ